MRFVTLAALAFTLLLPLTSLAAPDGLSLLSTPSAANTRGGGRGGGNRGPAVVPRPGAIGGPGGGVAGRGRGSVRPPHVGHALGPGAGHGPVVVHRWRSAPRWWRAIPLPVIIPVGPILYTDGYNYGYALGRYDGWNNLPFHFSADPFWLNRTLRFRTGFDAGYAQGYANGQAGR